MVDSMLDDQLAKVVLQLLEAGPLALGELVDQLDRMGELDVLCDDGVDEAELELVIRDEMLEIDEVWQPPDGVVALSAQLTDGMVLTHRLTADELERGEVLVTPDLVVLDRDARHGLDLSGGGRMAHAFGPGVPGEDDTAFTGRLDGD